MKYKSPLRFDEQIYEEYARCKNQPLMPEKTYYWIFCNVTEIGTFIGGQTALAGWEDKEHQKEIYVLREINVEYIEDCAKVYGEPLVLYNIDDVKIFNIFHGNAVVEKSCCEKYLRMYLKPIIKCKKST